MLTVMFGSDGILDWGIASEPGGFDRAFHPFDGSGPGRLRYVGLQSEPPRRLPRIGREFPNH